MAQTDKLGNLADQGCQYPPEEETISCPLSDLCDKCPCPVSPRCRDPKFWDRLDPDDHETMEKLGRPLSPKQAVPLEISDEDLNILCRAKFEEMFPVDKRGYFERFFEALFDGWDFILSVLNGTW